MLESIRIEPDKGTWRIIYSPSGYVFTTTDPVQVRKAVELLLIGDDTKPVSPPSLDDNGLQAASEDAMEGYEEWANRIGDSDEVETTRYPVGRRSVEGKRIIVLERRNARLAAWVAELEARLDRIEHLLETIADSGGNDEV